MHHRWYIKDGVFSRIAQPGASEFSIPDDAVTVTVPDGVTKIGWHAFSECTDLTSIALPPSVTEIDKYVFHRCSSLTSIVLPDSIAKIGEGAFSCCTALTGVTLPHGVTELSDYLFADCTGLTAVSIPQGVTAIGESAFRSCTVLTDVSFPEGLTDIGSAAFFGCTALTNVTLPESVTTIKSHAFEDCSSLSSINLPSNLDRIANEVFRGCTSLASLSVPASVRKLGYGIFRDCPNLTVTTVPGSHAEQWLLNANMDPTAQIDRSLQEWRQFFDFSLRTKGARITRVACETDVVYMPDKFGKTDVAMIDKDLFPEDIVVLCSKTIFGKLPKPAKICTAVAFLHGCRHFTDEQREYLIDFVKKSREDIVTRCIRQDDAMALNSFFSLFKKAVPQWTAAFDAANDCHASACIAMLLEYRHTHKADFPDSDIFSLE